MKYHKIDSLFHRDSKTHKVNIGKYRDNGVEALSNIQWMFKDKIDGTNIRIYWDGHDVKFEGRKDNSEIPKLLLENMKKILIEEMFEQVFGGTPVTLYGEGYGGKIQKGTEVYGIEQRFILFDVMINGMFLEYGNTQMIAKKLGIDSVPVLLNGTISEGIKYVQENDLHEGLVGIPHGDLRNRKSERIIIKLKNKDLK